MAWVIGFVILSVLLLVIHRTHARGTATVLDGYRRGLQEFHDATDLAVLEFDRQRCLVQAIAERILGNNERALIHEGRSLGAATRMLSLKRGEDAWPSDAEVIAVHRHIGPSMSQQENQMRRSLTMWDTGEGIDESQRSLLREAAETGVVAQGISLADFASTPLTTDPETR